MKFYNPDIKEEKFIKVSQIKNGDKLLIGNKVFTVKVADSFFSRLLGLMGKKEMKDNQALLITKCNSIHTFFMRFNMDAVFLDKNMVVKKSVKSIKPCSVAAEWSSSAVLEFMSKGNEKTQVEENDKIKILV
ncbi:DUF192 domain-containing protein [Selenomonas montiformis]|uniref:DUF192 domain-containing protein n=1 Tax=Selenomonas montiformis TaxID=2652285 RepID=UPI003F8C2A46